MKLHKIRGCHFGQKVDLRKKIRFIPKVFYIIFWAFLSFWIFEVDLSCSSVHTRARWNLKFDVISGGSSKKIENSMSEHTYFVIFILWTFSLGPRWTFDNTYMNAILNLGTFQPLWTFAVNLRNLEIDPACTLESHLIQYQVVVNKNWKLVVWAHWFFYFYSLNFYFKA